MQPSIRLEGLADLERVLGKLPGAVGKRVSRKVLKAAGEPIRAKAASLAPDDPSTPPLDLHTSIAISPRQKGGRQRMRTMEDPNEVLVYVGPTREGYAQAIMMEFGTFKDQAQPYMAPAWDSEKDAALGIVATRLGAAIHKTAARYAKRSSRS